MHESQPYPHPHRTRTRILRELSKTERGGARPGPQARSMIEQAVDDRYLALYEGAV
jgi:hypothetical protein